MPKDNFFYFPLFPLSKPPASAVGKCKSQPIMRISASFDPSYCYAWKPQQCTRAASEADFLIPSGDITH
jgi:hypothetical protein